MEAVEKTLIYREDDPGLYKKLLPGDKDKDTLRHTEATRDESNYVDLGGDSPDMKSEGTKTVKVTFTGEGNQLAVFECNSDTSGDRSPGGREQLDDSVDKMYSKDNWEDTGPVPDRPPLLPNFENGETTELQTDDVPVPRDYSPLQQVPSESEELRYTDIPYLNSTTESDDATSVVMSESDQCATDTTVEDESHYITTHEIQLTELDHDVDYDFGRGTRWDLEDDNLVYSFVDYASFESDAKAEGRLILQGRRQRSNSGKAHQSHNNAHQRTAALVSMEFESDLCDSDKCASSDSESVMCKHPNGNSGNPGQIHLSIKTSSRAINDARAEALMCDKVPSFIPAPGRQHLATKLRGKDVNEYSSGTSGSISELDDADKEVRNLTAKSFRSLACPYFDALNLSTSSESSSISEYGLGLNKWSAFVDLNYGNMSNVMSQPGKEQSSVAHQSSTTAMFEMSKNTDYKATRAKGTAVGSGHVPQPRKVSSPRHASSSSQQIELSGAFQPGRSEVITLTETLNFRCNVEAGLPELGRLPKCSENARGSRSTVDEVTGPVPARLPGCEAGQPGGDVGDNVEDTHKKAIFASSLLKNVISKKMKLEHERKMERGGIRDRFQAQAHAQSQSPCFPSNGPDVKDWAVGRGVHRQTSESGSGFASNSTDESGASDSRPASCEPMRERGGSCDARAPECVQPAAETGFDVKRDTGELTRGALGRSQNSAFKSWRDGELEPQREEMDTTGGNNKLIKLSQLFVPSSQLLSKDTEAGGVVSKSIAATVEPAERRENTDNNNARATVDTGGEGRGSKAPEMKICLRSVKENKANPFNIANLLTPNIGHHSVHPLKAQCPVMLGAAAVCHTKVPHFTVRDIRDNKCKFQTPIHHVRDVRKLVKSSYLSFPYSFVALDNGAEDNKATKKEPDKNPSPNPIIIKCHSVKTKSSVLNQHPHVADAPNEPTSPHRAPGRLALVFAKQPNPDQLESHLNPETKTAKQRQEKPTDGAGERKPQSKVPKQAALEKLKAAVKTMEQLYIFDRNEWKRKTQAPRPITDSHVLSLIAREEQGGSGRAELEEFLSAAARCDRLTSSDAHGDRFPPLSDTSAGQEERVIHVPYAEEAFQTQAPQQHSQQFSNQSVFHVGRSEKLTVANDASLRPPPQAQAPFKPSGAPLSLKIVPPKRAAVDRVRLRASPTESHAPSLPRPCKPGNTDSEKNYLTMPVGVGARLRVMGGPRCGGETKLPTVARPHPPGVSVLACGGQPRFRMETGSPNMPTPPTTATIYHRRHPALPTAGGVVPQQQQQQQHQQQPQVFCFSSVGGSEPNPPSPAPSHTATPSPTPSQRKMLLDPITGNFYLVDTPLAVPAVRRLYDPETGRFLDVPVTVPQTPVPAPVSPVLPVPLSVSPMSPLALPPGAYTASAPTYMIYPGFLSPPPLLPVPGPVISLAPPHTADAAVGKAAAGGGAVAESPYYTATGGRVHATATLPMPVTLGKLGGAARGAMATAAAATANRKPVISITQQGPRIVAPPSFDGTTMSFVVEHR